MRKSQLNAISRAYTAKHRKDAEQGLLLYGITYEAYCAKFNYKGSPRRLLTDISRDAAATLNNVDDLRRETYIIHPDARTDWHNKFGSPSTDYWGVVYFWEIVERSRTTGESVASLMKTVTAAPVRIGDEYYDTPCRWKVRYVGETYADVQCIASKDPDFIGYRSREPLKEVVFRRYNG